MDGQSQSLAERLKNPGCVKQNGWNELNSWSKNVRRCSIDPWIGSLSLEFISGYPVYMDHRGHAAFTTEVFGARALFKTLASKYRRGLITPRMILRDWAPVTDTIGSIQGAKLNDPDDYARFVEQTCGMNADEDCMILLNDVLNEEPAMLLAMGIEHYEAGHGWVNLNDWKTGFSMAQRNLTHH